LIPHFPVTFPMFIKAEEEEEEEEEEERFLIKLGKSS
jgi:hypothetical protein